MKYINNEIILSFDVNFLKFQKDINIKKTSAEILTKFGYNNTRIIYTLYFKY